MCWSGKNGVEGERKRENWQLSLVLNGEKIATIQLKQNISWIPGKAELEEKNIQEFLPKWLLYLLFIIV